MKTKVVLITCVGFGLGLGAGIALGWLVDSDQIPNLRSFGEHDTKDDEAQ